MLKERDDPIVIKGVNVKTQFSEENKTMLIANRKDVQICQKFKK